MAKVNTGNKVVSKKVEKEKDPIKEARRYVDNAKDILRDKAIKDNMFYKDRKYVKMAGNTAWNGVLIALNAVFEIETKKDNRPSIDNYRTAASKYDKKILNIINACYDIAHCSMGYDGNLEYNVCKMGITYSTEIIDWCEIKLAKKNK